MNYPIIKCAIFCLLAFSLFQAVFTWGVADVKNLREQSMNEMYTISNRLEDAIWVAAQALEEKGLDLFRVLEKCWSGEDSHKFSRFDNGRFDPCDECYNKALKNKNAKFARRCCRNEIAGHQREATLILANVKKCLAKCIHEAQATRVKGVPRPRKVPRNRRGNDPYGYQYYQGFPEFHPEGL